jgi:hypothetical protein
MMLSGRFEYCQFYYMFVPNGADKTDVLYKRIHLESRKSPVLFSCPPSHSILAGYKPLALPQETRLGAQCVTAEK